MTCNRVAIINRGRVVATNTPDELVMQLQGEVTYELLVSGAVDTVRSNLLQIPGVTAVETMEGDRLSPGQYLIKVSLSSGQDVGPDIASTAIGGGLRLFEMKRNQASLEEVFLELTTTEKAIDKLGDSSPSDEQASEASAPSEQVDSSNGSDSSDELA